MRRQTQIQKISGVTIRRLGEADLAAVTRLAQLDSADVPGGALLGAEVEGKLVAAVSIAGGEAVADPFSRTSELRALLELRATQLRGRELTRARGRGLFARRHARPAVPSAPSPPGAGGRLLSQSLRPY